MDYCTIYGSGRATADAKLFNIDDKDKTSRAVFTIAINISIKKQDGFETKSIFRRIVAWGHYADYVAKCQNDGGLKGRLIFFTGSADNQDVGEDEFIEVIRVGFPEGKLNIIDRKINVK